MPKGPTITVPDSLRAKCQSPDPSGVSTVGDLAAHSVRQEAAIRICDERREALVGIIDGANKAQEPKKKLFGMSWRF